MAAVANTPYMRVVRHIADWAQANARHWHELELSDLAYALNSPSGRALLDAAGFGFWFTKRETERVLADVQFLMVGRVS
jgi:hypothetical protein